MAEAERRQEARAVPEEMMATVTPMVRGAYVPAWYSRISWGGVVAGAFVAIAAELLLGALGILLGLSTASAASAAALSTVSAAVFIWTVFSVLIALFIGGWVASRIANARFSSDGLWTGLTVWAVAVVVGIFLGALGISGLLGFAGSAVSALRGLIPAGVTISPADLRAAAGTLSRSAGYFLLGALLSLATALLGGWFGSDRMSRSQAMKEEAMREHRAAA